MFEDDYENESNVEQAGYPSRPRGSLQKSSVSLKIWKPMPQNIPLRKIPKRKSRNGRNSGGNCRRKPLPVWRTLPERKKDFENVIAWWDRLDANRERRERYHELSRSGDDLPLEYGASVNELFFPDTLNGVLEKQLRKGDFLDVIFCCPYDIHELVTEKELSQILLELNEEHKELLFLCAVRLFSSTRIAGIRDKATGISARYVARCSKRCEKKLLAALTDKAEKQQPMTLLEKEF